MKQIVWFVLLAAALSLTGLLPFESNDETADVDLSQMTPEQLQAYQQQQAEMQQQLMANLTDEQKQYIAELKEDRRHLREERDDLRNRQDKTDENVRDLQMKVARYGRILECMRPFLCGRDGCAIRVPVTISPSGEIETTVRPAKNDIDPYNGD